VSTTPRPKSLAILFLVGAFLTGGVTGFAAERAIVKPAQRATEMSPREELARELKLTAEQKEVVDDAWDWRRARTREIMTTVRPALDSVRDSARVLMMGSLTDEQKAAFRRLIERNQRMADSMARARGDSR
jgi:hypothetical protein